MTCFFNCHCAEAKRRSNLPGGRISARYMLRTFSVGYFADAQYDVKKEKYVILNDSEESHDLSEEYMLRTFSVGYFVCAQYDVFFLLLQNSTIRRRSLISVDFFGET